MKRNVKTIRQLLNFAGQDSKFDSGSYIGLKELLLGKESMRAIESDARFQEGEEYKYPLPIVPADMLGEDLEKLSPKVGEYADLLYDKLADYVEGKKGQVTKVLGIDVEVRFHKGDPLPFAPYVRSIKDAKTLTEKLMRATFKQMANFADQDSKIDSRSYINLKELLLGKESIRMLESDARFQEGEEYKYPLPIVPANMLGDDLENLGPKVEEYADLLYDKLADYVEGKRGQVTKVLGIDVDVRFHKGDPLPFAPYVRSIKDAKTLTEKLMKATFKH